MCACDSGYTGNGSMCESKNDLLKCKVNGETTTKFGVE